jgi:hypothetical protein
MSVAAISPRAEVGAGTRPEPSGVSVGVALGVAVGVIEGVGEAVCEGVGLGVGVSVAVGVSVGRGTAVSVGGTAVGVGVGSCPRQAVTGRSSKSSRRRTLGRITALPCLTYGVTTFIS